MDDASRAEALAQVRLVLAELPLDDEERDLVFRAVVEYGHAAATDALEEVEEAIVDIMGSV